MDKSNSEHLNLPDGPQDILKLLKEITSSFKECLKDRYQHIEDKNLDFLELIADLHQLDFFLAEYRMQISQCSPELYAAAESLATSVNSTLHHDRIQQFLKTELPEIRISNRNVRIPSNKVQLIPQRLNSMVKSELYFRL